MIIRIGVSIASMLKLSVNGTVTGCGNCVLIHNAMILPAWRVRLLGLWWWRASRGARLKTGEWRPKTVKRLVAEELRRKKCEGRGLRKEFAAGVGSCKLPA